MFSFHQVTADLSYQVHQCTDHYKLSPSLEVSTETSIYLFNVSHWKNELIFKREQILKFLHKIAEINELLSIKQKVLGIEIE